MKTLRISSGILAGAFSTLAVAATVAMGACKNDNRTEFEDKSSSFVSDAASEEAPRCGLKCSIDGRSVIENCTGQVVETCAPNLACGAGLCQEPCAAAAADRSSNGCDFFVQEPRFEQVQVAQSCYAAYVTNTSSDAVTLSLELEGQPLDVSRALFRTDPGSAELSPVEGPIAPGETAILFLSDRSPDIPLSYIEAMSYCGCPDGVVPATHTGGTPKGTGYGSAFHLTTNVPVSMATIFPFGGASSAYPTATLVLPVPTWAKQHILINGWEMNVSGVGPGAQIFASEDETDVTIVPNRPIADGAELKGGPANAPLTYRLDKGQFLQIMQNEELTGSFVTSTKPTSIVGGHACANVPTQIMACDVLAQQIPAFEQWGNEYVGVGFAPRLGSEHETMMYRVVAARDGTRLDYDPAIPVGAPVAMSAGEFVTFQAGVGDAFVIRTQDAQHPIYVAAYMPGSSVGPGWPTDSLGRGDPDFVNVVPTGQYLNSYSFYADPTFRDTSLVLVRAKVDGEFKDVSLDCAGTLTGWTPVGTRGDYEYKRVILSREYGPGDVFDAGTCQYGLQRAKSEGPFTATIWGTAFCASYAYTGGMALRKLVDTPLLPH